MNKPLKNLQKWLLPLGLLLWAAEVVIRKPILPFISPWLVSFITTFGIAIFSTLLNLKTRHTWKETVQKYATPIFITAFCGLVGFVAFFWGLSRIDASVAGFVKKVEPIFVLILAYFWLGERIEAKKIPYMAGAFVGLALLGANTGNIGQNIDVLGLLSLVLAGFAWSGCTIGAKMMMNEGVSSNVFTVLRFWVQTLLFIPVLFIPNALFLDATHGTWALWVTIGTTVLTTGGFLLYYAGLKHLSAGKVAFIEFLNPLYVLALSFIFLGERFTPIQWFGAIVMLFSVWGLLKKEKQA